MEYIQWLRRHIGHRKTILVYATIVLQDEAGCVLLQQRSDFDWWGLPGGILEPGEDILDCARRELIEETGLHAGPLRLVGVYSDPRFDVHYPNGDEAQQFSVCFAGSVAGGVARPDGDEIVALAYFSEAELASLDISPWYRAMIADTLHADALTFDPPTPNGLVTTDLPEWQLPGTIVAAAVAVVRRQDGRVFMPIDAMGAHHFPSRLMRLGETTTDTAVRAAGASWGDAMPVKLLGIVSAPGHLVGVSESAGNHQVVAAVMLLRAVQGEKNHSEVEWVSGDALGRTSLQANHWSKQVARVLSAGYFLDGYEEGSV